MSKRSSKVIAVVNFNSLYLLVEFSFTAIQFHLIRNILWSTNLVCDNKS